MKFARTSLVALLIPTLALVTGCDDAGKNPSNTGGQGGQGGENQGGGGSGGVMGGSLSLDTSYGDQGVARIDRKRNSDQIFAATLMTDGSILLGGSTDKMHPQWAINEAEPLLVRLTPTGQLDMAFGDGGFAAFPVGTIPRITSLAPLPDGGAIAAGDMGKAFVMHVNAQGKLDTGFGTSGVATIETQNATKPLVGRVASGTIMLLTRAPIGSNGKLWITALSANGQVDTTFGTSGHIEITGDQERELLVDSNNKLLVLVTNSSTGSLHRLNADGTMDTAFGNNGVVDLPIAPYTVEQSATGELLIGGKAGTGKVMKLDASGKAITTFGVAGVLNVTMDAVVSVKSFTNGDMLIAEGNANQFPMTDFRSMKRIDSNGNALPFDETTTKPLSSSFDFATVLVKNDQAFLAGGRPTMVGSTESCVVALEANGSANASFGASGIAQHGSLRGAEAIWNIDLTSKKSILACGIDDLFFFTRIVNGALDPSYGMGGYVEAYGAVATGVAVDAQDRVVTAGSAARIYRFDVMGNPDATFGMNGQALPNPPANMITAVIDSKQRILSVGSGNAPNSPALVRLLEDGSLDASFGAAGVVTNFQPITKSVGVFNVLDDPNGHILVAGWHNPPPGMIRTYVVRFLENGTMDPSFGTNGAIDVPNRLEKPTLTNRSGGGYLLAGRGECLVEGECPTVVMAFDPNGQPDASFGEMGATQVVGAGNQVVPVGIAELPDGSLVVTGAVYEHPARKFAVWRLGQDGSADPKGPFVLPGKGYATSALVDGNMLYVGGWAFSEKTGTDMVTLRFGL